MKIGVVCAGMDYERIRLQPRRYIHEFCKYVQRIGIQIIVFTDGYHKLQQTEPIEGVPVIRLGGVRHPPIIGNNALQAAIEREAPDALVWHIGMTSMLHLDLGQAIKCPIIAFFTSPVYQVKDLLPLGISGLVSESAKIFIPAIGTLVPSFLVRRVLEHGPMEAVIVLSNTTKEALIQHGISHEKIFVVLPGVDRAWLHFDLSDEEREATRRKLNLAMEDFVVVYFGPPDFYRGSDTLLQAVARAASSLTNLKLLLLSRRRERELEKEQKKLENVIVKYGLHSRTRMITHSLTQDELIRIVASTDVVALPFKLVSSEAPLSIFEAMALGKPVISTWVNGLPEILAKGRGVIVRPNAPDEIADTLRYLVRTPHAIDNMGRKAKVFARSLGGWSKTAQEILNVIEAQLKMKDLMRGMHQ